MKLSKVEVTDFQGAQVFEGEQGDRSVKGKLLEARDESRAMIRCQPQRRNLCEARV
jgi:hypothetical protein